MCAAGVKCRRIGERSHRAPLDLRGVKSDSKKTPLHAIQRETLMDRS
jgi:hypothetical protein